MKKKIVKSKSNGKGIWAGTFLEEVEEVLRSKKLSLPGLSPVKPGEEPIGKMTKLEKALKLLSTAKIEEAKAICATCSHSPEEQKSAACKRVTNLKDKARIFRNMAWELVEDRLKCHEDSLAIREKDQIVKLHPMLGLPGLLESLRALVPMLPNRI